MEHGMDDGCRSPRPSERSDRQLLAAACKLRRVWRRSGVDVLTADDILVIGLLAGLSGLSSVAISDDRLALTLQSVFAQTEEFESLIVGAGADHEKTLHLISLDGSEKPDRAGFCLAYGLRQGVPVFGSHPCDASRRWLIPLAFLAPALWRSSLAHVSAVRRDCLPPFLGALVALLRSDWLDPLELYEQVHRSTSARPVDRVVDLGIDELRAENARLLLRLRDLEQSGLVRHELEVAKAVARERHIY